MPFDWPVALLSPLEGVYAAVTRRTTDGANPDGWQPQVFDIRF
jgi:predicted amidohydrolase YtcJ